MVHNLENANKKSRSIGKGPHKHSETYVQGIASEMSTWLNHKDGKPKAESWEESREPHF